MINDFNFCPECGSKNIQNVNMRKWKCDDCGFTYAGGVAIGGGEMIGRMMASPNPEKGPVSAVLASLGKLAEAVDASETIEDIYTGPAGFPRFMYKFMSNRIWIPAAKRNGLKKKDLLKTR